MDPSGPTPVERRRSLRAPGPFNGWWLGKERTRIRVIELSVGGCLVFVDPRHPKGGTPGRVAPHADDAATLQIDLGAPGIIEVVAVSFSPRPGGTAVTFLNVSIRTADAIRRTVDAQQA